MLRTTVCSFLAVAAVTLTASTAAAQNPFNPFTWFGPQPVYGNAYGNCPNGNCGINPAYRNGGCPNGNSSLPGACANGQCGVPNSCPGGLCPTPNYGGFAPNYRSAPYAAPQYGPRYSPQYEPPYSGPSQYAPYSAQRPLSRSPSYDRSVTPAGGFDWDTPTMARRSYHSNNSPFYP